MEIDYVEHCGSSAAGEFVCTIDGTCIASGWEEWEAVMGRGQIPTKEGLDKARSRSPFDWKKFILILIKDLLMPICLNILKKPT